METCCSIGQLAIRKWPNHHRVPEVVNDIAVAYQMHNEFESAIATRSDLTEYVLKLHASGESGGDG